MNRNVVHEYTALLHHLLDVAQAQLVRRILAHADEHHLKRIVQPFQNLAKCAADQTLAEIKHGADCRLGLLQHNPVDDPAVGAQGISQCAEVSELVPIRGVEQLPCISSDRYAIHLSRG